MGEIFLWVGIALTLVLFITGVPIYVGLGIGSGILALLAFGLPPGAIASMFVEGLSSFTLLALPLFIYLGDLYIEAGAADALLDFMRALLGRVAGGLGAATVIAGAFLAAVTGSSTAAIATLGLIMVPHMRSLGYEPGFAGAITSASGCLGAIIPPSIYFILFASLVEVNSAAVFAAGMLPGIITAIILLCVVLIVARRKSYSLPPPVTRGEKTQLLVKAIAALLMPIIVLGSIYGGVATPTEAAGVGCVYAIVVGLFVYRKLTPKTFWKATMRSVRTIGALVIMIGGGMVLGRMFVIGGFPEAINLLVMRAGIGPIPFLLLASVVMGILGLFLECIILLYVSVPMFYTTALSLAICPFQLCMVIVLAILVGANTPPMAEGIYIASGVAKVPAVDIIRHMPPFLIGYLVALVITIFVPELSLAVPRALGFAIP